LFSQQNSFDSLKTVLKNLPQENDTTKLRILVLMGSSCELNEILKYSEPAIELADKLLNKKFKTKVVTNIKYFKAIALNNFGFLYDNQGKTHKALDYYNKSLLLHREINNMPGIAGGLNNIGFIYYNFGDIKKALDCWQQSLKLEEASGNEVGLANTLNNLGAAYENLDDTASAYESYRKSAAIEKKINNKHGISISLINLAHVYHKQKQLDNSLNYYQKALVLQEEINDHSGTAIILSAIGLINSQKGNYNHAIDYLNKSLTLRKNVGDKQSVTQSYMQLGSVYLQKSNALNMPDKKLLNIAYLYSDSSLKMALDLNFPEAIRDAEKTLSEIEVKRANHKAAFEHYENYIKFRNQINNQEIKKAGIKNQLKYEFEKKEAVLKEQQEKENILANELNQRQKIAIWLVVAGLLLVIIFSVFVIKNLRLTRKQKNVIENKQKEILDSIHYAKRIQNSLLPNDSFIGKTIKRLKT